MADADKSPPASHRVGRLRFEIDGADEDLLLRMRQGLAEGAETWIPQALDDAFAALDRAGEAVRIERLEVDLGTVAGSKLTPERLREQVRAALAEKIPAPTSRSRVGIPTIDEEGGLARAIALFLETGRLPWWSPVASLVELESTLLALDESILRALAEELAPVLRRDRPARRLALQVEPTAALTLIQALRGILTLDIGPAFSAETFTAVETDANALESAVAFIRVAAGAKAAAEEPDNLREAKPFSETHAEPPLPPYRKKDGLEEKPRSSPQYLPQDEEATTAPIGQPVVDAGLVLAGPFLPVLFGNRALINDRAFVDGAAQMKAVHLASCLAAGEDERREPDMIMAKLLCGWPLAEPVARRSLLDDGDREEAENLLAAMIGHWEALGKASASALRETFLTRLGLLSETPEAWRLTVERRGPDVLLGRLPWSVSPVRLPWMVRPILVEWI